MFKVGDKVLFGRKRGEKTLGEIVSVGRSRYKVKQLEARGTLRDYDIGSIWEVPFTLVSAADGTAPAAAARPAPAVGTRSAFKKGDRVEFDHPSKGTIAGTVARVNAKTVTLEDTSDGHPVGWRVGLDSIRAASGGAAPAKAPATAPAGLAVGKPVAFEGNTWEAIRAKKGPVTVTGVVTLIDARKGMVEVFSASDMHNTKRLPFSAVAVVGKRSDDEILDAFHLAYSRLEPEWLTADGERSRSEVTRIAAELRRAVSALAVEYGRMVDDSEAFRHGMKRRDARSAV